MAPGKGLEPLRAKGPLAGLPTSLLRGSRGQRDNHSATPAQIEDCTCCLKTFSIGSDARVILPRRLLSYFELLEMSDKRMMTMAGLPREVLRTRNVADKKEWAHF